MLPVSPCAALRELAGVLQSSVFCFAEACMAKFFESSTRESCNEQSKGTPTPCTALPG